MESPEVIILPNGLQVLLVKGPGNGVAHCGLLIGAGTREEDKGKEGLAHFIEHCLFKGTKRRKSYHILNRLECVGGELNAYTTKEETCLHASVMEKHLDRALELISDIAFHSTFPLREIEKEKDVIVDEIHSYEDAPYEQIFDDFEGLLFRGHPLGHPILGFEQSVRSFRQKDLREYTNTHYVTGKMVLAVSSGLERREVLKRIENHFGALRKKNTVTSRKPALRYRASEQEVAKQTSQLHHISGRPAYGLRHPDRYGMILLNNLLGGPGMNSLLNLNIRERYGYAYTVESGYHTYTDGGIFHVYFATDPKHHKKTLELVSKELNKLAEKPISETRIRQYKEQLIGQIRLAQENRLSVLLAMSKSQLNLGHVIPLEEIFARIQSVTTADLKRIAREMFDPAGTSTLTYMPS